MASPLINIALNFESLFFDNEKIIKFAEVYTRLDKQDLFLLKTFKIIDVNLLVLYDFQIL